MNTQARRRHGAIFRSALLGAAALVTGAASAADNGIYLGASAGSVSTDWPASTFDSRVDDDTTGFNLIGGVRPFDVLAIEAKISDLGTAEAPLPVACLLTSPCPSRVAIDTRAVSVSALGMLTLPLLDVYGRVGVARWEADTDVHFTGGELTTRTTRKGTDPAYGLGLQLRFSSVAVRIEYERLDVLDTADSVSIGFTYTFL